MSIQTNQELENIRRSLPANTPGLPQQFAGTKSPMEMDTANKALVPQGYDSQGNRIQAPGSVAPTYTGPKGTVQGGQAEYDAIYGDKPTTITPTATRYTPPTSAEVAQSSAEELRLLNEQHEKQRQETMNRINAKYDTQSQELMAQQRAINYNRGQVGAESGLAAKNKVSKAVEDERTGAISQALQALDDVFYKRSQDVRTNARADALYDLTAQQTMREMEKADRDTAKEKLAALGAGNATVETIMTSDPNTYKGLTDLGFGDVEIDAYLTAGRTEENKVKVTETYEQGPDGSAVLVRTKYDPVTNKMSRVTQPMGVSFASLASHKPVWRDSEGRYYDEVTNADGTITATPIGEMGAMAKAEMGLIKAQTDKANRPEPVGGSGLTPYQQFTTTQALAKDTQARTEKAREMVRQAGIMETAYNNYVKGGDKNVATQAIIGTFNKVLDPTSVVREGEYDRTAKGQSLLGQIEGKARNIVEGGTITPATLKAAVDLTKEYLKGAQDTIVTQNQRAEQMALQFGLNPEFVSSTGANVNDVKIPKTLDDYKAEFPQASPEELQALMAEEQ
jgi:hypothetical protein